ncbi:hypothetical protein NDR87_20135 [Nocardia sp. CDC159]|uniref:YtkA-like domain-containing protein n=1 Tax=Nocardia pulmonis TaxID=2951408 RepID=A0A9X2E815_9NOCA|nr:MULTISPECIES: hypothetical protein [Nocardia]MCM6775994.1 hypothetical protein [Nocardia pulmonis]MCM6788679.1 hypothetical protein [Nocardia sp. CDC159]
MITETLYRTTVLRVAGPVVVVGLIVAVVGWLLWPSPPGPLTVRSGTERHLVTVTVANPRVGDSEVDIEVTDRDGRAAEAMVHLEAIEPRMGYAAPVVMAKPVRPGLFRAVAVAFMSTGPWELRLSVRTAEGDDRIGLPLWISG